VPVLPVERYPARNRGVIVSKNVKRREGCTAATAAISLGSRSSLCLLRSLGGGTSLRRLLLLRGVTSRTSFTLTTVRRCPQCQIVSEQLHDKRAVAVRLFGERIELGDSIVKGLLGKVTGTVGRVEDFVVEDTEVQGETKTDGVGGGEFGLCDIGGVLGVGESV